MIHPFIIAPYRYIRQPAPTCSRACTRPRKHNGLFKMPFACLSWHLTHTTAHHGPPLTFAIRYHIMIVSSRCEKVDGWKRLPSSALYFSFLKLSFFLFFSFFWCLSCCKHFPAEPRLFVRHPSSRAQCHPVHSPKRAFCRNGRMFLCMCYFFHHCRRLFFPGLAPGTSPG